jgi:hypothetical protein
MPFVAGSKLRIHNTWKFLTARSNYGDWATTGWIHQALSEGTTSVKTSLCCLHYRGIHIVSAANSSWPALRSVPVWLLRHSDLNHFVTISELRNVEKWYYRERERSIRHEIEGHTGNCDGSHPAVSHITEIKRDFVLISQILGICFKMPKGYQEKLTTEHSSDNV